MKCENCLNTGQVLIGQEENQTIITCPVCKGKSKNIPYYDDDLLIIDDDDYYWRDETCEEDI